MNLYRLDYIDTPELSVTNGIGQQYLTRHADKARADAIATATTDGEKVAITRISGSGRMKHTLTAHPSGKVTRA